MAALAQDQLVILESALDKDFVPQLPPLLNQTRPAEEQARKNRSRAFSAYALHNLCRIPKLDASHAVVDDFDDYGIDAVYYHAPSETLYIVQSKLKAGEQFSQDEALAFCQGVRKLIRQDFDGFNQNVRNRQTEIEGALDDCSHIRLVVAHTGSGISKHAEEALTELLDDEDHGDERVEPKFINYDSTCVIRDLAGEKAYEKVNADLSIHKCVTVNEPRLTYFGLVKLSDLVTLHQKHGKALYEKNIRTFLGHKTEVNASIQRTLATKPEDFVYLNNGVTALCDLIDPKSSKKGYKRLKLRGFSVINGAQTIASSAAFVDANTGSDIGSARVSLTLIKADTDGTFGKAVTRARNHQNPVLFSNFAALDDEQERLRRELAHLGIEYVYKAEAANPISDPSRMRIDEAAQALAMLQPDPRFIVWLKKEPSRLLDTASDQYKVLFMPGLTAFTLANAVRVNRYLQARAWSEARQAASSAERLAYRHGNHALAWVFAKRLAKSISNAVLVNDAKLKTELSAPFDQLRQVLWDCTRAVSPGPLSLFRNQTHAIPLVQSVSIRHYGLEGDPVVDHKKKQQKYGQPYPEELFAYLAEKAPQIGNLA
jgi:hypothetical protein